MSRGIDEGLRGCACMRRGLGSAEKKHLPCLAAILSYLPVAFGLNSLVLTQVLLPFHLFARLYPP